jgi:hypothetical protein
MRLATYTVAPGAECGVYFFGAGQGGSMDANRTAFDKILESLEAVR